MKNLTRIALALLMVFSLSNLMAQSQNRYIDVSGTAEIEVEADEIHFMINIKEYWEEEFQKRKEFKDYKSKVSISKIETELLNTLKKIGVAKSDIRVISVGNYHRYMGKDFLVAKMLDITLSDFTMIDKIVTAVNPRGINSMRIGFVTNKDIEKYQKEVKIQALNAAKEKAKYLVEAVGAELGEIITISEFDLERPDSPLKVYSNARMMEMSSDGLENEAVENFRKIKLRYVVNTRFAIK